MKNNNIKVKTKLTFLDKIFGKKPKITSIEIDGVTISNPQELEETLALLQATKSRFKKCSTKLMDSESKVKDLMGVISRKNVTIKELKETISNRAYVLDAIQKFEKDSKVKEKLAQSNAADVLISKLFQYGELIVLDDEMFEFVRSRLYKDYRWFYLQRLNIDRTNNKISLK